MVRVFQGARRGRQGPGCAMAPTWVPHLTSVALLCLLTFASHCTARAYLLVNYQQQQQPPLQSPASGLLPNGYNLAASNSLPSASAVAPPTTSQQLPAQQQPQQPQQQDNQALPAYPQDGYSQAAPSESAGASPQQPQQYAPLQTMQQQQPQSSQSPRASRERDFPPNESPYGAMAPTQSAPPAPAMGGDREPIFRFQGGALNATAAKLYWSLRSGHSADSFELKYGPIPEGTDAFSVRVNGSARDLVIGSLQPGELYEFRLTGIYGGGASGETGGRAGRTRIILVQIPPLQSGGAANTQAADEQQQQQQQMLKLDNRDVMPLGVKAEAKSNQSIQLNWSEQERPAGLPHKWKRVNVIRYYVVSGPGERGPVNSGVGGVGGNATSASSEAQQNTTTAASGPRYHYLNISSPEGREARGGENRVVIQKLRPATEYAFAVRTAYYYAPEGKKLFTSSGFSMDTLAKTHDLEPSAVRNFTVSTLAQGAPASTQVDQNIASGERPAPTSPTTVELTWAPPESPNGPIRAYWVLFTTDLGAPDDKWSLIQINDTSSNFWQVGNLKPGLSYYFKMRALNQRGPGPDSQTRVFATPAPVQRLVGPGGVAPAAGPPPIPANNLLMLIVICLVFILFVLFLVVSRLFCRTRSSVKRARKNQQQLLQQQQQQSTDSAAGLPKLNGFGPSGNSSTVTARMGTLARRSRAPTTAAAAAGDAATRQGAGNSDYWISAMEQQQAIAAQAVAAAAAAEGKSNMSERSNSDMNMAAMVSLRRDSPQQYTTQTTTQLMPEYRQFAAAAAAAAAEQQLMMQQMHLQQQQQQQGHYHTGHHAMGGGGAPGLSYDQMDGATASALMTLSKRQQAQMLKFSQQMQFGGGGGNPGTLTGVQAPSPHQQPPPPPPLNIEQQQQQQQPLYGTHGQQLQSTRSLRIHKPPLSYDPVSGSFAQQQQQPDSSPPNYNSHLNSMLNGVHHQLASFNNNAGSGATPTSGSNTLQFHPSHNQHQQHHTGTLTSRRSTATLRSFGGAGGGVYGQLGGAPFAVAPPTLGGQQHQQQQPGLLQNHQAVINQLNQPQQAGALPTLKHVSAVRPQIMSSLEDQIEMELAEKQAEQQQQAQRGLGPQPLANEQQQQQQHSHAQ